MFSAQASQNGERHEVPSVRTSYSGPVSSFGWRVQESRLRRTLATGVVFAIVVLASVGLAASANAAGPQNEIFWSGNSCCNNHHYDGNNHFLNYNDATPDGSVGTGGYYCAQEVVWPNTSSSFYDSPVCVYDGYAGHTLDGQSIDKALCWYSATGSGGSLDCQAWWP